MHFAATPLVDQKIERPEYHKSGILQDRVLNLSPRAKQDLIRDDLDNFVSRESVSPKQCAEHELIAIDEQTGKWPSDVESPPEVTSDMPATGLRIDPIRACGHRA